MTEKAELRRTLSRLREEASAARAFFHTWRSLDLAIGNPEYRAMINDSRYVDFFLVSISGSYRNLFLSMGKIFDNNRSSTSLQYLQILLNHYGHKKFAADIENLYSVHERTIMGTRIIRNKGIAHIDSLSINQVFIEAAITPDQIEDAIDSTCYILNNISRRLHYSPLISDGDRNQKAVRNLLARLCGHEPQATESLRWSDVQQFFEEHGCIIKEAQEIRWYREAWFALETAGFTEISDFEDRSVAQFELKLRAICLLAMYLGVYQAAGNTVSLGGYFDTHLGVLWYLESLGVDAEDIWEIARREGYIETQYSSYSEDEDIDDDYLSQVVVDVVREQNHRIFFLLYNRFNGNWGIFRSWLNSRKSSDIYLNWDPDTWDLDPDTWENVSNYIAGGMKSWEL